MCASGDWRSGVPRSPSHESVTTDLSLFSVSSAASDAKMLRLLASRAGQGPDINLRVASPNPEGKSLSRCLPSSLCCAEDSCREVLTNCAALCASLGLRRSFSAGDIVNGETPPQQRFKKYLAMADTKETNKELSSENPIPVPSTYSAHLEGTRIVHEQITHMELTPNPEYLLPSTSNTLRPETPLDGSSESNILTLCVATGISNSMWAVSGGSQLPSPQRTAPVPQRVNNGNSKIRQSYIKRRLLSTYRALERMSQSEFNLDKLEAAAVCAVTNAVTGPGPTVLAVPKTIHSKFMPPEAADLALTAADLERERGRPLTKYERNMMIFNWLHTLDEADAF